MSNAFQATSHASQATSNASQAMSNASQATSKYIFTRSRDPEILVFLHVCRQRSSAATSTAWIAHFFRHSSAAEPSMHFTPFLIQELGAPTACCRRGSCGQA